MNATINCPLCGGAFEILDSTPGTEYDCPHCNGRVRLAGEAAAPPAPPTSSPPTAPPPTAPPPTRQAPPAAARRGTGVALKRTCPECGNTYPTAERRCPACGAGFREAKYAADDIREGRAGGSFAAEKAGINMGVVGGLGMIVIAAIWFFAGLAADIIFFYPPVLALIGIFAIFKGLATGNMAGQRSRRPSRAGRRRPGRRRTR